MLPSQDVRVVSINLAYNRDNMEARGEYMMPLLLSYEPDSIGTQENDGYTDWLMYFEQKLPNYERVGLVSAGEPKREIRNCCYSAILSDFFCFFESEL